MKKPTKKPRPKPDPSRHPEPMRTCIITRDVLPAEQLLRLSASPEGLILIGGKEVNPDNGRGAWVVPTRAALAAIVAQPARVAQALKLPTVDTSHVLASARSLARRRILDFVSLCARSGRLASGAEMATAAVRAGDAKALLIANDASAASLDTIRGDREIPVYTLPLDRIAFGAQIGKGPRAVVALRRGGPSDALLLWLDRAAAMAD